MVNNCRNIERFSNTECHLWHLNLLPYLELDQKNTLLDEVEVRRMERYLFERDQQRFGACRKLLKLILASYLKVNPVTLTFDTKAFGKPFLPNFPIHFNLSHSGDYLLLGISLTHDVGVDIEQVKSRDFLGLARHSFSALEIQQVESVKVNRQAEVFYRIWSQKEAYIKLDGRGLRYPLKDFSVSAQKGGGLIHSSDNKKITLVSYLSAPNLYAAYCMNASTIDSHFFTNADINMLLKEATFD